MVNSETRGCDPLDRRWSLGTETFPSKHCFTFLCLWPWETYTSPSLGFLAGRPGIRGLKCISHLGVSDSLRPSGLAAGQNPWSMEFSRQEYWSGLPFPSAKDLPNPGIKPRSPALQADSLPSEPPATLLLVIGVFIFSIYSWFILEDCMHLPKNLSQIL